MSAPLRVGYLVKRYPRFSETFIVNELLAHEAAGLELEIFALRPTVDAHFQDAIARVRAPVTHLAPASVRADELWSRLASASELLPGLFAELERAVAQDPRDVVQALEVALAVASRGIGHLHAHFATSATSVARLAAAFAGVGYSFTAHAKDLFHEDVRHDDLRAKVRDATAVIAVSEFNARFLRELCPAEASRVVRIYNGLPLQDFPYGAPASRPRRVVAVGRLIEKKGFETLVDACALLRARGRDFECRIIGSGELAEPLARRIEARGLGSAVQLVGALPRDRVVREMQAAAALAAPCVVGADGNRDGLPTVIVEAMLLGTPCVATPVTGIPELLRHDETGLLVAERDVPALAAALERLLDDSNLCVRLARAARAHAEREHDAARSTERMRELWSAPAARARLTARREPVRPLAAAPVGR